MSRQTVFELLPGIWRRLDADGTLERFLGLWEDEIQSVTDKIKSLMDIQSPDMVSDKFLPLLGNNIGYAWRDDKSFQWNRNRIKASIRRYSYKGTRVAQTDIITEFGGDVGPVLDMASTLLILGRQGRLGSRDCVIIGPDFYHDGSYLHDIDIHIDTPEFYAEFEKQRPAGHVWWYRINHTIEGIAEIVYTTSVGDWHGADNVYEGVLGRTLINYLPIPHGAVSGFDCLEGTVDWQYLTNTYEGVLGRSALGSELSINEALGVDGGFQTLEGVVDWQYLTNTYEGTLGRSSLNADLSIGEAIGIYADFDVVEVIESGVGVIGGTLWANSLFLVSDNIPLVEQLPADLAGIHTGFDVTEELEV